MCSAIAVKDSDSIFTSNYVKGLALKQKQWQEGAKVDFQSQKVHSVIWSGFFQDKCKNVKQKKALF